MRVGNKIRVINLVGMNLCVLFFIPYYLNLWGYKNDYWTIAIFGVYLFLFFAFWVFIYFIVTEVRYVLKEKINFFKHVINNKLVFWGILPFIVYLTLWLFASFKNNL